MVETFGAQYEQGQAEESSWGGVKFRLKRIDLRDPVKFDMDLFVTRSKVRAQRRSKNVALAPLASNAAGSSIAVS